MLSRRRIVDGLAEKRIRAALQRIGVVALVSILGVAVAAYFYADALVERRLRPALIEVLQERFHTTVALEKLTVRVAPLRISGEGLTLRHQGRTDIPPLITIRAFTVATSWRALWARHVDQVHLDGLEIMIPPGRRADMPALLPRPSSEKTDGPDVSIGEIVTENGLLTIMAKREGKRPRVFQLRRLRFEDFRFDRPTPFEAALTNPTPTGEISVVGAFGPWARIEPRETPLSGSFTFDSDLGTIDGIGGELHAEGTFDGPLEAIRTRGRTRTEGFHLSTGGARFPLLVDYDAVVDGTNGDTILQRVVGQLGRSHITARGAIVQVEGVEGRRITLDTTARGGRIEDFVMLTTRVTSSPLTGLTDVTATLDIPPGRGEVIDRMSLDGTFSVAEARFTSRAIQDRIDELSRRGQGRPTDETIDNVASNLRGAFQLRDARMVLRRLSFTVRGAEVRLAGHYDVRREQLDFQGTLRLQARASRTQTGWKSVVLKLFDPLLDGEGAGTVLPISVTGTRAQPKFAADVKKALLK